MCEEEMGRADLAPTSQTIRPLKKLKSFKSWPMLMDRRHGLLTDKHLHYQTHANVSACLLFTNHPKAPKTSHRGKGEAKNKSHSPGTDPQGSLLHLQLDLVDLPLAISDTCGM